MSFKSNRCDVASHELLVESKPSWTSGAKKQQLGFVLAGTMQRSYKPQPHLQLGTTCVPQPALGSRRRRRFGGSHAAAPTAPLSHSLQTARSRGRALRTSCGSSSQRTTEVTRTEELPQDSARRTVVVPLPPGIEANNAVMLRRRSRQQQQQRHSDNNAARAKLAATVTAAAAEALPAAGAPVAGPAADAAVQHGVSQPADAEMAKCDPPGSVLGAVALITGSTVGAGILALPSVAAPAGFGPSTGTKWTKHFG